MKQFLVIFLIVLVALTEIGVADTVVRREGLVSLQGKVLTGSTVGLRFEVSDSENEILVLPWSTILTIESTEQHTGFRTYLKAGENLWRAKIRLLRGDVQLAEPIFLQAFEKLAGSTCEDAILASEGLLRCAISRGDLTSSVHPWIETVRLIELGFKKPFPDLTAILDESTMLCPHLPPVWVDDLTTIKILHDYTSLPLEVTSSLASLLIGKQHDRNNVCNGVEDPTFLSQVLAASTGNYKVSKSFEKSIKDKLVWKQAWLHYFIAKGFLAVKDSEQRTPALLHLAKAAAMKPSVQPWITGASMLLLSDELKLDGLAEQSRRILDEARAVYPAHPLFDKEEYKIRMNP